MLTPKKQKYRKVHRNRGFFKGMANNGNRTIFGAYGLKAEGQGEATSRQIEAARRAMTRYVKRGGKIWIRIFPHKPVTQKAAEVPMGSGKGNVEYYIAPIKPGKVIFEIDGVSEEIARRAMELASHKLPFPCKFVININK
ncbi:MAG TPA: 50S ribosomal protein L16 [Candidatus Peregrinibacteria bacterium]|nr:50S ribosomal protein L16 [Candidatus Peregrinibacteria bacterium]